MKKFSAFIVVFFLIFSSLSSEDKNLSSLMKSSYKSGFYPGVVRYAEEILRTEKNSTAAFRAAVYEGESLFRMGRLSDAIELLQKYSLNGDSLNPETVYLNSAKFYWLGRSYYFKKEYQKAQSFFYTSAAIFKDLPLENSKNENAYTDYYAFSMLFAAKSYTALEEYKKALPLYEYVASNGLKYSVNDYSESVTALARSYILAGDEVSFKKCVNLVSSLENAGFDEDTKYSLLVSKGEALENLKNYREAYDTYCIVIEKAPSYLAATAMQKAYEVSANHRNEVKSEPGNVLANAESRLSEYPDLLSEFWTRLAVDAFYAKDYKKSLSYFEEAEPNSSNSQKEISAVYRAETAYLTSNDKDEGSRKAREILTEALKIKSEKQNETVLISLARYNGFLKSWKDCSDFALKCINSSDSEIEKNAVYWLALSKYENGDTAASVNILETYSKKQKITDKSLLILYAKALAKQGKYHDADVIFYSLGEKNLLDNDGYLDYSRTLLIAGHYVSTKQQAKKAAGDEAVYISALASFNQHNWTEAENSFSKIIDSKNLSKEYVAFSQFYLGYSQYQNSEYSSSIKTLNRFISENPLHSFVWSAYMTIARAAAFEKMESEAVSASKNAVKAAKNENEKQEALILTAGILSDCKKFDEAIELLSSDIKKRTEFGYECKYRTAEILVQKGNLAEADKHFEQLASNSDKKAALVSEQSAYRRAELAYSSADYNKAAHAFEEYNKKWPEGRFAFASIYFSADSLAKTGSITKAILRYQQITDSNAETSYRYGAEKNLVDLYEKNGDYAQAIAMAEKMIDEYGSQAVADGMDKKIKSLKQNTVWNVNSTSDRIKEAEKALAKQKNDSSKSVEAMQNALYLAGVYRTNGENKKSAEMYLEALKYSRQSGNDENAARSFYGAVESFDAAALYADAKAAFNEMIKLYPDNKFTKDAEKIINQY
ncbi:tetratricopeptide repeat protein [Treponema sp.]|uniref:tetratricopeptide repeat protein n=1 Tax=Treponema sp. TaxID=166 RepID=UPI00388D58E7